MCGAQYRFDFYFTAILFVHLVVKIIEFCFFNGYNIILQYIFRQQLETQMAHISR